MIKNKAYRAVEVKHVSLEVILGQAVPGAVTVGIDLGKFWFAAVVRFADGPFLRPWKVKNPWEIEAFVRLLERLSKHHSVTVAMESTGSYGDAWQHDSVNLRCSQFDDRLRAVTSQEKGWSYPTAQRQGRSQRSTTNSTASPT